MKFFGRQNEIKEFQYRIPGVVDGGHVKLCGIYSTIMDINYKNVSSWLQGCFFLGSRIYLLEFKNISFGVQVSIVWGTSKYRLGYKHISFGVQGSIFLNVVTRLSRRAEPCRQVCWLQSARLLSLVATPLKRTTIYLLVVRLYTS